MTGARSSWIVVALGIGVSVPAWAQQDPGITGPYAVTVTTYNDGDLAFTSSSGKLRAEGLAQVRYPTNLSAGPFPLAVFLHGWHTPCYLTSTGVGVWHWPCVTGESPVPSYAGYDYMAQQLASHGTIVVSISANGINAVDNSSAYSSTYGMQERAELVQYHLNRLRTFSTTGGSPFGATFVGKVDLTRVGTMGHSRGGEAVIWHYQLNQSQGNPFGVHAVLPIAPTNVYGRFINSVPVGVLLAYCDGDAYDLPGVAYVDDARHGVASDNTPKYTILGLGANHNFFNRYWTPDQFPYGGAVDDWNSQREPVPGIDDPYCGTVPGNGRLTSAQQRGFGLAYVAAFFRKHLLGTAGFEGILNGDSAPPPSAMTSAVYNGYIPGAFDRKDLNRLATSSELSVNTLGGGASFSGFVQNAFCGDWSGVHCSLDREPHYNSLSSLQLGWASSGASYTNLVPDGDHDLSNYAMLQFRAAVNPSDSRNPSGQAQDFSVVLIDGAGRTASVRAGAHVDVLYYPPAYNTPGLSRAAPVMNTVRIPMSAFVGIDRTNVASVRLVFDQKPIGGIMVSDIAFADEGMTIAEVNLVASGALM